MQTVLRNVRYGLRMLAKSPGFTALVVLSLALGIGANTAIFSAINALMLRTLPVHDPQALYLLQWSMKTMQTDPFLNDLEGDESKDPRTGGATSYSFSYPAYRQFQDKNTVFSDTFAFAANEEETNLGLAGRAIPGIAQGVSGNLFSGLGVSSALGRTIVPDDDRAAATPVAVISYAFWSTRMGSDVGAIGRTISINGTPLTIVGVAPAGFSGLDPSVTPDLWIPLSEYAQEWRKTNHFGDQEPPLTANKSWWVGVVGRLKPGISKAQASAQLSTIFAQSIAAYNPNPPEVPQLEALSMAKGLNGMRAQFSQSVFLLMGMVGLVLLIACSNVAGLLLARASSRQREIGLRIGLGATKARVAGQLLTESIMLGILGGGAALLVARWASELLVGLLASGGNPVQLSLQLDGRVLAFTAAISILSGIVFGLAPSLALIRTQPSTTLNQSSATTTMTVKKFRSGKILVGGQVALSLLLLISAGVLLRTLEALQHLNLGFDQRSILMFTVRPGLNGYSEQRLVNYYDELERRVRAIPGVRSAAFAQRNPIGEGGMITMIEVPGYTAAGKRVTAYQHVVSPGYFDTMKIPVTGRALGVQDTATAPVKVVVNQAFAKKYFHGDNPLGHEVQFGTHVEPRLTEIVGVAQDVKYESVRDDAPPTVYVAYTQTRSVSPFITYELRIAGDKSAITRSIEREALATDPAVPVVNIRTEDEVLRQVLFLERTLAFLSFAFGALALALACVGIYGTIAYTVAQRTKELGIRMALGAERAKILRMVLRETLVVVGAGLIVGLPLAILGTRMLTAQLYGLSPHDPLTLVIAILAISTVTIAAGFVPARRASRVDPMKALRYE
ncbi:MAG TPA: ABC transporter permease [Candidatus Solibacter sp.]|nr:ABC transporter permease [Candidatus Solibacter sp.]